MKKDFCELCDEKLSNNKTISLFYCAQCNEHKVNKKELMMFGIDLDNLGGRK
jgi:hypothetical protein